MFPLIAAAAGEGTLPADLSGVVVDLFNTMADVVTAVKSEPMLLIGIAAVVGGIGISWFKRLTGQRSGRRR